MGVCNSLVVAVAAVFLVACGGGGNEVGGNGGNGGSGGAEPAPPHVKVVGDSLADSGTFGIKFTVQGAAGYPIWVDKVAAALQMPAVCSHYTGLGSGTSPGSAATAACTNHAVGGGRVNTPGVPDSTPLSIVQQLKNLGTGAYAPNDLLLVTGGANDLAELVQDYLKVTGGDNSFVHTTSELVTSEEGADMPRSSVGEKYATRLADLLADAVTAHALDRGAQRVMVLTVPDLSRTPRFTGLMAGIAEGGVVGQIRAEDIRSQASGWSRLFNDQLKKRFEGQSRVLLLDLRAELDRWMDVPEAYGLTNTTRPACPSKGRGFMGVPNTAYDIRTCVDVDLSATPPAGESGPDWWKTYLFADDFHGTPRAHELLGAFVVRALEARGWK